MSMKPHLSKKDCAPRIAAKSPVIGWVFILTRSSSTRDGKKSWAIKWLISDFRLRCELSRTILDFRLQERISTPLLYFLLIQNRQSKIRNEQRQRHRCV